MSDVGNVDTLAPLWPIIHFKRWILRHTSIDPTTVAACASEVAALLELCDYDPDYNLRPKCPMFFGPRFTDPLPSRAAELWRRLVEARMFVEDYVNDALEETLRVELLPPANDDFDDENWEFEKYWRLQTCILRLQLDVWKRNSTYHLLVCIRTLTDYKAKAVDEVVDIEILLDLADELQRFHRFFVSVDRMKYRSPAPEMEHYQLDTINKMLLQVSGWIVGQAGDSNLSVNQSVRFKAGQQLRLLKHLFARNCHMSEKDLYELVVQIVPDNSSILLQLADEVAAKLQAPDTHLLPYLLDHQRGLFDAFPGPYVHGKTTMFTVIYHHTSVLGQQRSPRALALLRHHEIRVPADLNPASHDDVCRDWEYQFRDERESPRCAGQIYAMVEFGLSLSVRRPRALSLYMYDDEEDADLQLIVVPCTLLDRLILGAAKSEAFRGNVGYPDETASEVVDVSRNYLSSKKATVWRFLIAEHSPAPHPLVLGLLLKAKIRLQVLLRHSASWERCVVAKGPRSEI